MNSDKILKKLGFKKVYKISYDRISQETGEKQDNIFFTFDNEKEFQRNLEYIRKNNYCENIDTSIIEIPILSKKRITELALLGINQIIEKENTEKNRIEFLELIKLMSKYK
jgi:hypothetical protein